MTKEKLQKIKDLPTAEDVALLIADNENLKIIVKKLKYENKLLKRQNKALKELEEIYKRQERQIEAELDEYGYYKG